MMIYTTTTTRILLESNSGQTKGVDKKMEQEVRKSNRDHEVKQMNNEKNNGKKIFMKKKKKKNGRRRKEEEEEVLDVCNRYNLL